MDIEWHFCFSKAKHTNPVGQQRSIMFLVGSNRVYIYRDSLSNYLKMLSKFLMSAVWLKRKKFFKFNKNERLYLELTLYSLLKRLEAAHCKEIEVQGQESSTEFSMACKHLLHYGSFSEKGTCRQRQYENGEERICCNKVHTGCTLIVFNPVLQCYPGMWGFPSLDS